MKTVFLSLLLLNAFSVFSQKPFTVEYRTEYLSFLRNDVDSNRVYQWMTSPSSPLYKLSVDNDLSYFRIIKPNIQKNRHAPILVEYYTDSNGAVYYPVAPITEKPLLAKDLPEGNWLFTTDTDTILGFPCRRASKLIGKEYVDAWYCWELPGRFGPFTYSGLPGTILRVETTYMRYSAINVNEETEKVNLPETAVIDGDEYRKMSREKRMYRAGLFGKRVDPYEVPRITRMRF
ncbi:MAG: GLPGLI family protein [Ferruginibacter sp.]